MHHASLARVQAGGITRPRVGEAELLASPGRERDLPVVHVACEHEVERARRQAVEDVGEVAEQDSQLGRLVDERPRLGAPGSIGARIDADELDAVAAELDGRALVDEERVSSRSVNPAARENGSLVCSTSWLPSTAKDGPRPASSSRSSGSPERRETRSPVMTTRSGARCATHPTALFTARSPREGSPRWKSERCAMRRPASSAGSR